MKAIFEMKFKQSDMIDRKSLKEDFDNDITKLMKYLYEEDDLGIFDDELKLIKIIK